MVFKHSISDSAIYSLNKVEVGLHLAGDPVGSGWASEMFVGINKDLTTSATILNQPGVTTADLLGAGYNGWNVTFSDTGLNGDIQTYLGNYGGPTLTGEWRPAEALSIFGGAAANGDWLLSVADLNLGGTMRLESWSLTFVGVTTSVPETDSTVLLLGIGLLAIAGCRRINGASVTRKRGL